MVRTSRAGKKDHRRPSNETIRREKPPTVDRHGWKVRELRSAATPEAAASAALVANALE
jgi:hypothetical protein